MKFRTLAGETGSVGIEAETDSGWLNMELVPSSVATISQEFHLLVYVGLLLLLAYSGGEIANRLGAPRVTGYLLIGMLLGPSFVGLFHAKLIQEDLAIITHIALGVIAFSIGGSLRWAKIKNLGKQLVWITVTQALGAFFVATLTIVVAVPLAHSVGPVSDSFWSMHFPVAIVIGAICAATAPAAVLAIIHEYRARGPLTTMLLGVVALDDALTIFLYAFAVSIAGSLVNLEAFSWLNLLLAPAASLLLSLFIGGVSGFLLQRFVQFIPRREGVLGVMAGAIFLASGLAVSAGVSALLANMTLGFVVANFVGHHQDLFAVVENIEESIFGMFFALAGAHLDLQVIESAGWLALVITVGRFVGKLVGCRIGARMSNAPSAVKRYLGLALLPTAGVTVGLVLEAKDIFAQTDLSTVMVSAVLGSVVINELLTPFLLRFALFRAGEARMPQNRRGRATQ